jgi:acid phosphatase type 7
VPTPTSTSVPTSTSTPVPVATATDTPVPTPTSTSVPTSTSTPVPTNTLVPTPTNTPVAVSCPGGWSCGDVGSPTVAGSQSLSGGTWTIQGAGSDIWGTADQFHYVWQSLAGDGSASAHVAAQSNTDPWAKAGVMLRQNTKAGSPYYFVFVTPSNGINVQYRATQGGSAVQLASLAGTVPTYLKAGKSGGTYTAYTSSDGVNWTAVANSSVALSMTSPILDGMAVLSHNTTTLSTVTMDTVAVDNSTDPIVMAAGDIACSSADVNFNGGTGTATNCQQKATSDLLMSANPSAVLPLGDEQYDSGTLTEFQGGYDPTWGRKKAITYPAPGNHEYVTAGASGYYTYFGAAAGDPSKGYYSYNVGKWHVVALNSNCSEIGGCNAGSPEEQWLRADLAANTATCTLAYWHHPLFSSGGTNSFMQPIWQALYDYNADLVLDGHVHSYERFAPQNPSGVYDATRGIREFVVGTGGKSFQAFTTILANSEVHDNTTFGTLKLVLHPTTYDWQFMPDGTSGTFTDSGSGACH